MVSSDTTAVPRRGTTVLRFERPVAKYDPFTSISKDMPASGRSKLLRFATRRSTMNLCSKTLADKGTMLTRLTFGGTTSSIVAQPAPPSKTPMAMTNAPNRCTARTPRRPCRGKRRAPLPQPARFAFGHQVEFA